MGRAGVMVEGSSQETFPENGGLCISLLIFCQWNKRGKRLFSFGMWILGHTGPGVSQSGQFERRRRSGRGVLGGLIRRMLSHHPSRQAGENWLAPRRVEFTGGAGGGSGALDTCHSLWSVSGSQQQINKISSLLPFTCRGSSPSRCSFSQLAPALWPLPLLREMRGLGSRRAGQSVSQKIGRNSQSPEPAQEERLPTSLAAGRQLHFRQTDKRLPRVRETFWSGDAWEMAAANKQQLKQESN